MRWHKLTLLSLLLFLAPAPSHADAPNWSQPVFGIVEAGIRPTEALQLGVQWERLTFHWDQFQPTGPDDFNTNAISGSALDSAFAAGRQVVGMIKGTPPWASTSGLLSAVPIGLDLPYNDPGNTFARFVARLVAHYGPQGIHHWIIWNEPDIRPNEGHVEFEGEVEDYFLLLKSASLAARSADPNAHIQLAGLTWWYDSEHGREPYLLRLLRRIAADPDAQANGWYFDGISVHIYFTTSTVPFILEANRAILGQFGLANKQLWLNEFNASPRRDPVTPIAAPFNLSLEQQADFIVQTSALALASGVDRLAVYKLYDSNFVAGATEPWGLVRADGSLRPAFHAYQQVIANFSGARNVQRYSNDQATLITLSFSNRTLHVMWNDTFEPGEFLLYSGGSRDVAVTDSLGNQWTESPIDGAIVLDAPPAEQVDVSWVVVAGPVRLISLSGGSRTVYFRSASGALTPLN